VEELPAPSTDELEVEIVERKGRGHPDTLIDGAAEAVSQALSHHYLDNFGKVLHYNVDKGILVGGRAEAFFGGGRIIEPIYVLVAGRATTNVPIDGTEVDVPVREIARGAIRAFIRENVRFLDPDRHVQSETRIKPGSPDLVSIFMKHDGMPLSNDTSIGVGYAPLTPTEKVVLNVEHRLNSPEFKASHPEVGEDIKVLALRRDRSLDITVACAMVSSLVPDVGHYVNTVEELRREIEDVASGEGLDTNVQVNTGDDYARGTVYLTVTGTSAEQGDDGNTGRGNRVNGLISPMRHFSMEATAGKNPVSHTGKIFNAVALLTANRVVQEVHGVRECYVRILSRIGRPIDQPEIASAGLILHRGERLTQVRADVESIMDESLGRVRDVTGLILERKITLF